MSGERLDWKLSEIFYDEIVRYLRLDESKMKVEQSNMITELADDIAAEALDNIRGLEMNDDFDKEFAEAGKTLRKQKEGFR